MAGVSWQRPWRRFIYSTSGGGAFGDGADGNVTISVNANLSRDMYYDNLTIQPGGVLNTNGYRVFVKTLLLMTSGAIIQNNGAAGKATGGDGGAGATAATVAGGTAGGEAAWGTSGNIDGSDGVGSNDRYGGAGGAGANGSVGIGGQGGLSTFTLSTGAPYHYSNWPYSFKSTTIAINTQFSAGGGGGGGGGGDGVTPPYTGGGGGGGGGMILLCANEIQAEPGSIIRALGGNGADGEDPTSGLTAGGGGGGGGVVYVFTNSTSASIQWTASVAGGSGGGVVNVGQDGSAGLYVLQSSDS